MTGDRQARMWCELLGWRFNDGWDPKRGMVFVWYNDDDIRVDVFISDIKTVTYHIGLPTLAIATLVRHAGPVDVGPCPECEGDGVQHWGATNPNRGPNEFRREGWLTRGGPQWAKHRACPSCPPRAKNTKAARKRAVHAGTGLRIVSAPEAVLLAARVVCSCVVSRRSVGFSGVDEDCNDCYGDGFLGGHEGAREALQALAEGWETLSAEAGRSGPVACDLGLSRGERHAMLLAYALPPDQPAYLHPCPDLGAWVLAWLDETSKRRPFEAMGLTIGPHLPAIYAHLTAAWERETVECDAGCWPTVDGTMVKTQREPVLMVRKCQRCAGLGRVRPEGDSAHTTNATGEVIVA